MIKPENILVRPKLALKRLLDAGAFVGESVGIISIRNTDDAQPIDIEGKGGNIWVCS